MESRKKVLKNLLIGQQWRQRHREQTYEHEQGGERRGWAVWREYHGNIYTAMCKIDS